MKTNKMSAKGKLVGFMAEHDIKLEGSKPTSFTRKDGKVVPAERLTFSNKKDYICTAFRFWKA